MRLVVWQEGAAERVEEALCGRTQYLSYCILQLEDVSQRKRGPTLSAELLILGNYNCGLVDILW